MRLRSEQGCTILIELYKRMLQKSTSQWVHNKPTLDGFIWGQVARENLKWIMEPQPPADNVYSSLCIWC